MNTAKRSNIRALDYQLSQVKGLLGNLSRAVSRASQSGEFHVIFNVSSLSIMQIHYLRNYLREYDYSTSVEFRNTDNQIVDLRIQWGHTNIHF